MNIKFGFNKIYIIESLFQEDIKTGALLYNDVIKWKTYSHEILQSEYIETPDVQSFEDSLNRIYSETLKGTLPFIHFEIHGHVLKGGFVLRSKELISWNSLASLTRKINISTNNNLIISLATCFGAYFLNSLDINEVAPFACCVSTTDKITANEIQQDFTSFFETVLTTTSFNLAVKELNKSNSIYNKYHFFSSEEFLELLFRRMADSDFNSKTIQHRTWVNSLTKKAMLMVPGYSEMRKKDVKEIVRIHMLNQKSTLRQELRKTFLNID